MVIQHGVALLIILLPLVMMQGSAMAEETTVQAATGQLATAFTYQGQLKRAGTPLSGACDFRFSLWDAEIAGAQQGVTQNVAGVTVADGLFTLQLDFGKQFTGDERWLEAQVKCEGDGDYTTLAPRVLLTASPYAMSLLPGAEINGAIASTSVFCAWLTTRKVPPFLGWLLPPPAPPMACLAIHFRLAALR